MPAKTQIVDFLGDKALVLPALLDAAIVGNERAKYVLSLFQMAASYAEHPQEGGARPLRTEREACGIADATFDRSVGETIASMTSGRPASGDGDSGAAEKGMGIRSRKQSWYRRRPHASSRIWQSDANSLRHRTSGRIWCHVDSVPDADIPLAALNRMRISAMSAGVWGDGRRGM
jgi:hypothetical protein